jgi:hypothetical protein
MAVDLMEFESQSRSRCTGTLVTGQLLISGRTLQNKIEIKTATSDPVVDDHQSTITADMDVTDLNDEQLQAFKEVSKTSV